MMTNLIDVEPDPEMVRCEMPVEIVFDDVDDDFTLPRFRPSASLELMDRISRIW